MSRLQQVFEQAQRPVSFRVNTLTSSAEEVEQALEKHHIPFTKISFPRYAYILQEDVWEKTLWNLDIYKQWKIYLQWLSSQLPAHIFTKYPDANLKILDACAAPWGKTSLLSMLFPSAEIHALEPHPIRYKKLWYNLLKLWAKNVKPLQQTAQKFAQKNHAFYDIILIDAPCSGEWWLSLHNTKFLASWSLEHVQQNSHRQKDICQSLSRLLKSGWEMLYTTCTLAPEENEEVVDDILMKHPELYLKKIDIPKNPYFLLSSPRVRFEQKCYTKEIAKNCLRIDPSRYSEWFFLAKFCKQ